MKRPTIWSKAVCVVLTLLILHLYVPSFVPSAQALYWEDDIESNSPKDRMRRPEGGFFLMKWIRAIRGKSNKRQASALENRDKGPGVNGGKKAIVLIASGIVGMGIGAGIGSASTNDSENRARNNFIGAALGLCGGLGIGALLMPKDYQVDPQALAEMKYRMAMKSDPCRADVLAAFRGVPARVSITF